MLPTSPEDVGAEAGERTAEAVAAHDRPSLCLWADSDPILSVATGRAVAERLRLPEPEVISGASHFLQEDQGDMIGKRISRWLAETSG